MSDANITDRTRAGESFAVSQDKAVFESFRRRTFWTLEKRDGDVDGFVTDRIGEARDVLLHDLRGYDNFTGDRAEALYDEALAVGDWARELPAEESVLWTPDRLVDAAVRRVFLKDVGAYEVIEREGNLLVTAGITLFLALLTAGGGTAYSNANAYLGVGDSATSAAVGQTDLQASSNKLRKAMNATYPTISSPSINFQASFGSSEANFAWAEVATFNASSSGTMLNRVVQALGTKSSGATWTLTETITWS